MFTFRRGTMALLGGMLACSVAGAAGAESDEAAKNLYVHYCSSCHGETGKGDGDLAEILEIKPTNLTVLRKNSPQGEFSYLSLLKSIDGRKRVRGHGKPEMPVWGNVFLTSKTAPLSEQLKAAGKLLLITYHVESLQEP